MTEEEYIYRSSFPDDVIPEENVIKTIFSSFDGKQDELAMVCAETSEELTYKDVQDRTYKWCGYLTNNFKRGTVVAVMSPNNLDVCICILGTFAAGMIYTGIRAISSVDEITRQLSDSEAEVVLMHPSLADKVTEAATKTNRDYKQFLYVGGGHPADGVLSFADVVESESTPSKCEVDVSPDDVLAYMYTSGTTGMPKCAAATHRNFVANLMVKFHLPVDPKQISDFLAMGRQTTYLHRSLTHGYGMNGLIGGLHKGTIIVVGNFQEEKFIETISKFKVTQLPALPAIMPIILRIPEEKPSILQHLKIIMSGMTILPDYYFNEFKAKFPNVTLMQAYAMTEANVVTIDPMGRSKRGCTGKLVSSVTAKIVDVVTGLTLPPNNVGEVCVKTPQMIKGYKNNPNFWAESLTKDGFFRTGDLGEFDDEGYLRIVDRMKDMIKCGLYNVYPAEIENVLIQHPRVATACVVGVKHPQLVEAPRAYVELKPEEPPAVDNPKGNDQNRKLETENKMREELHNWIALRLGKHMHLNGGVVILEKMPHNAVGKIDKATIKKMAKQDQ